MERRRLTSVHSNVDHMVQAHSFFIPDFEFLTDLEGLILYLGEKLSVANLCLYCNGKGRGFHTLEAVRGHMVSKGHCKILYEDGADLEIAEFYDFSETWEDVDDEDAVLEEGEDADGEWEDADNSAK
jgi:pre-60S factor REI1